MAVQDDDKFIVNRGGTDYKVSASDLDDKLQDDDQVLINRGGTDYKVSGADLREYLGIEKMPWDDAAGIYHVIISDPADIMVAGHDAIYNRYTEAKVDSINAPGEWIITGVNTTFENSSGNWEFGPLTDTSKVESMRKMFMGAQAFNSDLSMFDTSNVTNMENMFSGAKAFNQGLNGWDVSKVQNMGSMFYSKDVFNQDLSNWNVSNVENMGSMFSSARQFNQDISGWDVSKVTNMLAMFTWATAFNQDLSDWCVTNITGSPDKFDEHANAWTEPRPCWGHCPPKGDPCPPPPPPPWANEAGEIYHVIVSDPADIKPNRENRVYNKNTLERVESINAPGEWIITGMWTEFKNSPGNWDFGPLTDTSNVHHMETNFENCYNFNGDVSMFDFSSTTSTWRMFVNCHAFNQDISGWDVSKVTEMASMLENCRSFNQDLSGWCVDPAPSNRNFDKGCDNWEAKNKPVWGTCPRGEDKP